MWIDFGDLILKIGGLWTKEALTKFLDVRIKVAF